MASTTIDNRSERLGLPWDRYGARALVFAYLTLLLGLPLFLFLRAGLPLGLDELGRHLLAPAAWTAFQDTLQTAALVTALNALLGLVTAYVLVRHPFPGHTLLNALIDLPLAIPTLMAGGLWALFGPGPLRGDQWFVPAGPHWALLLVTFPFVVRSVEPALRRLGRLQEDAAASLGASSWTIFWRITLPPLWLPLLGGALLTFGRTVGELTALLILVDTLPIGGQTPAAERLGVTVISLVMLVVAMLLMLLVAGLQRQRQPEGARPPATVSIPRPVARIGRWRRRLLVAVVWLYAGGLLIAFLAQVVGSGFHLVLMDALAGLPQLPFLPLVGLGLLIGLLTVLLQGIFGTLSAWVLVHHEFPGRGWIKSLLTLPFVLAPTLLAFTVGLLIARSPRFSGTTALDFVPLALLVTLFTTWPLVVRELIPLLRMAGVQQAQTAALLGASSWQRFWLVTLPAIRSGLLYGAVLTFVRTLGDFSMMVVIGHSVNDGGIPAAQISHANAQSVVLLLLLFLCLPLALRLWQRHQAEIGK
jgi:sulfate transport system permease protein